MPRIRKLLGVGLQKILPRLYFPKLNSTSFRLQGYDISCYSRVSSNASITGNIEVSIDDYTYVGDSTTITGGLSSIKIGKNCDISDRVIICCGSHEVGNKQRRAGEGIGLPISIGNGVWIGIGAIVLPGVSIGNGCIIAAGSVVKSSFPDNVLIAGNPAIVKKELV